MKLEPNPDMMEKFSTGKTSEISTGLPSKSAKNSVFEGFPIEISEVFPVEISTIISGLGSSFTGILKTTALGGWVFRRRILALKNYFDNRKNVPINSRFAKA